tara:strand:+ start:326 stop:1150 length:825 start_codon:yes stop_codon:yes gene_type:complete
MTVFPTFVNLFETSIRALGGLMSAHFLTNDQMFREKSTDLGERLVVGFLPKEIAKSDVNLRMRKASHPPRGDSSLSEAALSLEFYTLSAMITSSNVKSKIMNNEDLRLSTLRKKKLMPYGVDESGGFHANYRLGVRADSFYEYLFKEFERSGNATHFEHFLVAEREIRDKLHLNLDENTTFVGERSAVGHFLPTMDHLVCFWPGVLALASKQKPQFLRDAQNIMHACLKMYDTPRGLAPEKFKKYRSTRLWSTRVIDIICCAPKRWKASTFCGR